MLGTEVALDARARSLPRGAALRGNDRGATIFVADPSTSERLGLVIGVTSGRCSYELEAEIAYR